MPNQGHCPRRGRECVSCSNPAPGRTGQNSQALRCAAQWNALRRCLALGAAQPGSADRTGTLSVRAYWAEALGGPAIYSGTYGDETSVVRIHSGNGPHEEMDRRAIACFDQALHDAGLDKAGPLRQVLHDYFAWATTTTMSRYHDSAGTVPEGMSIPRWSWDGLQR